MIAATAPDTFGPKKRLQRSHRANGAVPSATAEWHEHFLSLVPAICRYARIRFRYMDPDAREEAIQEVVVNTLVAYLRLLELGKKDLAYASPLARYGVAQFRGGRRVSFKLNVRDVMSEYCQTRKGVVVEQLDRCSEHVEEWQEIVVEDRRSSPAAIAATRIDFRDWLNSLSVRSRHIAETLAGGECTSRVAEMFGLSPARVSQLRREFCDSWCVYIGEPAQFKSKPTG